MEVKIALETTPFTFRPETAVFFSFEENLNKTLSFFDSKLQLIVKNKIQKHQFEGKEDEIITIETAGKYQLLMLVGAGKVKEFNLAKFKRLLMIVLSKISLMKYSSVGLFYFDELSKDFFNIGKSLSLASYLSNYHFDKFKGEKEKKKINRLKELVFYIKNKADVVKITEGVAFGKLIADGLYLTRNLVNEPASHIHPETLEQAAFDIEKESKGKIKVEVLDEDECRRLGMGAFLGVGQGSDRKPKFIILKYQKSKIKNPSFVPLSGTSKGRQNDKSKIKNICLIGKSITFDSGGLSLKSSEGMETMKIDMAGGAVVLGVFKILAHLNQDQYKLTTDIYGILPACENMPSGKAIKPGDVLQALNGKTIEVLNTDAEGRVVLADALSYAEKYIKPETIIDLATLTGACMVALGTEITGMFGNNKELNEEFKKSSTEEGEELWELPLYQPYKKKIKSDVADIKNAGGGRFGGAITAALFLQEFVERAKWIHLDIAGSAYQKGATGWGVTSIINYIFKNNEN